MKVFCLDFQEIFFYFNVLGSIYCGECLVLFFKGNLLERINLGIVNISIVYIKFFFYALYDQGYREVFDFRWIFMIVEIIYNQLVGGFYFISYGSFLKRGGDVWIL